MGRSVLKFIPIIIVVLFVTSCASLSNMFNSDKQYQRILTNKEAENYIKLGNIQAPFKANHNQGKPTFDHYNLAYNALKNEAAKRFRGNIDIKNIKVTWVRGYYSGAEWMATGDVVRPKVEISKTELPGFEGAIARAAEEIVSSIAPNSKVAIYIMSTDNELTEAAYELESILVSEGFAVIDRSQLDTIQREQNLFLSGQIDDETAVSIGKIAGATIIITGSITGTETAKRLRLRALNTETAQVMAVASERF